MDVHLYIKLQLQDKISFLLCKQIFSLFAHKHVHIGTELHAKSNDNFVRMGPSLSRTFSFALVALLVIIF